MTVLIILLVTVIVCWLLAAYLLFFYFHAVCGLLHYLETKYGDEVSEDKLIELTKLAIKELKGRD